VFYRNFIHKKYRFWDNYWLQKCRDLENRVRGPPRSLETSPFDRADTTSYWRSIVTMALSRVVSEIFNVEKCRDLEIGSKVTQGHRNRHVSNRSATYDFLLTFHSNHRPRFRDKRRFQSKIANFPHLRVFFASLKGNWGSALGAKNYNHGATGLDTIHQRVGRTDGQTRKTLPQQRPR